MAPLIGFVLATYNHPQQTLFLCNKLTAMFEAPPIAIHHDFGHCPIERSDFPPNVAFVEAWKPTRWGHISVVEAVIAAIRLLFHVDNPDWVVSLSTADYPIKTSSRILADLSATDADVLMDHREVTNSRPPRGHVQSRQAAFADPQWLPLAYRRYVATRLLPYRLLQAFGIRDKNLWASGPLARRLFTPFTTAFKPFGGDSWFTFNRRAAAAFLDDNHQLEALRKHYRRRGVPEESFYHTLLANWPGLTIQNRNLRFVDWTMGGQNPKLLGRSDIPALLASDAHFARKFPFDPSLFEEIDRQVARASV